MIGKRYSTQLFGGVPAVVGAPVFVTTSEGGLLAGQIHHITDNTAAPGYRDRVFVSYVTAGGWDDEPRVVVKALPFYNPQTREEADEMPPGHWCWPKTWMEEKVNHWVLSNMEEGISIDGPMTAEEVAERLRPGSGGEPGLTYYGREGNLVVLDSLPYCTGYLPTNKDEKPIVILRGEIVSFDEVTRCPCGSGKAFRACHGVDSIADEARSAQDRQS